jgi:hypothetical protein
MYVLLVCMYMCMYVFRIFNLPIAEDAFDITFTVSVHFGVKIRALLPTTRAALVWLTDVFTYQKSNLFLIIHLTAYIWLIN